MWMRVILHWLLFKASKGKQRQTGVLVALAESGIYFVVVPGESRMKGELAVYPDLVLFPD
jgi:hypothetical protein